VKLIVAGWFCPAWKCLQQGKRSSCEPSELSVPETGAEGSALERKPRVIITKVVTSL